MTDIIEDLFAFLMVTGEAKTCSRCGRELAAGEPYSLDDDNQVVCTDCGEDEP